MRPATCPPVEDLDRLVHGGVPESQTTALEEHVLECRACLDRLKQLGSAQDTLTDLLRQDTQAGITPANPLVEDLVRKLKALRPASNGPRGNVTLVPSRPAVASAPIEELRTLAPDAADSSEPPTNSDATQALGSADTSRDAQLTDFLAPKQADDELGRLGKYRIMSILGHGGMGVVYKAEDPKLERIVAIKAMLPTLAASASAAQRFLREARAIAKVEHDHIVRIYQVDEDRGVPFLAMEFLKGEPLDERLKREPKLPVAEVLRFGREIAAALAAAHAAGLIHRDIKPANIWLEAPGGRVKILDFGLARAASQEAGLTQQGAIIGTPAYMAPEQGRGAEVDARCDLWSLGVVLYRLCTGTLPFQGTDTVSTLMAVATTNPETPARMNADVPAALSELVMRLLEKDPAQRLASAEAVVQALSAVDTTTPARPQPRRKLPTRVSRTPMLVALGTALAALVVLGLLLLWQTPHGSVRIESDDPAVEIVFDQNGPTVKGADQQPITLRAGEHGVVVKCGNLTFETDKFLVKKGETITLKIELLKDGRIQASADDRVLRTMDLPAAASTAEGKSGTLPPRFKNRLDMEFALVPKGKAWLGGGPGKPGDKQVEVTDDFYLGVYEVTQEEWEKVLRANPSNFSRNGDAKELVKNVPDADLKRFPVENVSYNDIRLFLDELNQLAKEDGWVYRLPTATEWEYACRGGPMASPAESAYDYYFDRPTNVERPGQGNFGGDKDLKRPCKVGSYTPNRLGLYDMHGNVWEWCDDAVKSPEGALLRLIRGGSWRDGWGEYRASTHEAHGPDHAWDHIGLRLARVPAGKQLVKFVPEEGKLPSRHTNSLGMELALVPRGKAWLGGGEGTVGDREVEIRDDFYLGVYEVTQEEWQKVTGLNPSRFKSVPGIAPEDQKRFPVENVSWDETQLFLERLNKMVNEPGWVYRLPKEAEWEYACRGGPSSDRFDSALDFYFAKPSKELLPEQANFDHPKGLKRTCKVGSYPPNALGLYDMHGNVWEWCDDAVKGDDGVVRHPFRGGCFACDSSECQARCGFTLRSKDRTDDIGLRLARVRVGK